MNAFQLSQGQIATITKVPSLGAYTVRLKQMGVTEGAKIICLSYSLFHASILISVGCTRIVLRKSLAKQIEVQQ